MLDMEKIVAVQIKYLEQLLNDKGINIEMGLPVKKWLATAGYDPRCHPDPGADPDPDRAGGRAEVQ